MASNSLSSLAWTILIIYGLLAFGFYWLSDSVLFQPPVSSYHDDDKVTKIPLKTGGDISAVYLNNPSAKYTVLVSHGNAEDLGYLYPFLLEFYQQGFSVLAYDYAGYGTSKGKTSEDNTYRDIVAAYEFLTVTKKVSPQHILVFGRSLGTGPSVYLASRFPVRALILQSPFVTAFRVMTRIPLFPFDKYPNLSRLSKMKVPLLVIHGTQDEVIGIWHGKKIFSEYTGFKQSYWVENANHNELLMVAGDNFWKSIHTFVQAIDQSFPFSTKNNK